MFPNMMIHDGLIKLTPKQIFQTSDYFYCVILSSRRLREDLGLISPKLRIIDLIIQSVV